MAAGDMKLAYGSEAALTITLDNLAESAGRSVGRESTVVAATGTTVVDELIGGKIKTIASATSGEIIEVWAYGQYEDTPAYPGGLTGIDAAATPATPKGTYMQLLASITLDAAGAKQYFFGPVSLASRFGGVLPPRWGVWVTQSTDQNLDNAGGNNAIYHQPVYMQVEQ